MSAFLHKFNSDDVYLRGMIGGLSNLLHNELTIWIVYEENKQEITVPFFYNAGSDERFLQDIFLKQTMNDLIDFKVSEGNTDVIPRGQFTLSDGTITSSSLTNRFVRGEYRKEENGELMTYNAPFNHIPLEFTVNCEIYLETFISTLKMWQKIIRTFYKHQVFEFLFEGMVIRANVAFPESNPFENSYEFTFGDPSEKRLTFDLAIESYIPVMDETQKFLKSNRIESFTINWDIVGPNVLKENNLTVESNIEPEDETGMIIDERDVLPFPHEENPYFEGYGESAYRSKDIPYFDKITSLREKYNSPNDAYPIKSRYSQKEITTKRGNVGTNIFRDKCRGIYPYKPDEDITNVDNNLHRVGEFGIPNEKLNNRLRWRNNDKMI